MFYYCGAVVSCNKDWHMTIMSNYTQCQQMPSDARIWSTILEGIISLIIAIFGLGGNIVTMFILSRPCFNDVFHRLLATLSAFDVIFLGKIIFKIYLSCLHENGIGSFYKYLLLSSQFLACL